MTRYLERPGGRIAYDDTGGDEPLVVAVPGMGDIRHSFRFLTPELVAAGYRVVTMDLRGAGDSDATFASYGPHDMGDDIVALLDQLDADPAIIVGVSIASAAAVWAATESPERVAGVVLVRAYPPGVPIPLAMRLAGAVLLAPPWGATGWSAAFGRFFPTGPPDDLDSYRARLRDMLRQPGRLAALRAMTKADKGRANDRMGSLVRPALVVMGGADDGDPGEDGRLVAEAVGGTLVMVEGAGHYPHVEFPQETSAAIIDFARQVARA